MVFKWVGIVWPKNLDFLSFILLIYHIFFIHHDKCFCHDGVQYGEIFTVNGYFSINILIENTYIYLRFS